MVSMQARKVLGAAGATLVVGAALVGAAGPAAADDLPAGCTTADMTGVMSGGSADTCTIIIIIIIIVITIITSIIIICVCA